MITGAHTPSHLSSSKIKDFVRESWKVANKASGSSSFPKPPLTDSRIAMVWLNSHMITGCFVKPHASEIVKAKGILLKEEVILNRLNLID